jgi:glutamate racemase
MPSSSDLIVGVFDSGVGGLSVLRAIQEQMSSQPVIYFADQAHVPYGPRTLEEVRAFSVEITRFLLGQGSRVIVVACNAASAAALHYLREVFPATPFVGMEPAVKPAAESTRTRRVGVLATPATFQGELYASLIERFASDVRLYQDTCPGLVAEIEAGRLQGPETRRILESALRPMLVEGIDTIVLGCTHYPFVIPLIEEIAGPEVRVIDPAPSVARQLGRVLAGHGLLAEGPARQARFITSGDPGALGAALELLLGLSSPVERAVWNSSTLSLVQPA